MRGMKCEVRKVRQGCTDDKGDYISVLVDGDGYDEKFEKSE